MSLSYKAAVSVFFVLALVCNLTISFLVGHNSSFIVSASACIDLLLSLPVVYYLLLPTNYVLKMILVCECGIAWFLFHKRRDAFLVRMIMSELSILYCAFAFRRTPADDEIGRQRFSIHKQSGAATIFFLLAALSAIETALVHIAVRQWSVTLAWCLSAATMYGAVLLIAIARSFSLMPITVTHDGITLRAGILWKIEVRRDKIASILPASPPFPDRREPNYLAISVMSEPQFIIETHEMVTAEGLYGRRKSTSLIGVAVDKPRELLEAIHGMRPREL